MELPAGGCPPRQRARVFEFGLNDAPSDPRPFVAKDLYDPSASPIIYGQSGAYSSGHASSGSLPDMEEMVLSTESSRWVREYLSSARESQARLEDGTASVQQSQDLEGFQHHLRECESGHQRPSDAQAPANSQHSGEKRVELIEAPAQDSKRPARARVFEFGVNQPGDEQPYFAQDLYDPSAAPVRYGSADYAGAANDDDETPVQSTESGLWMREFLEARIRNSERV